MAGALLPRRPGALHADPRGREPRRGALGAPSCSPRRAATSTSTPRRPAARAQRARARHLARRRRPRRAAPRPARRSRTARRRTCSSAAACSTGARARTPACARRAWPATSAAAPACRCCAHMADAYKVQALAGERLTAWKALHAATRGAAPALGLERRDRQARAGPPGRRLRLGLGARPGRRSAATGVARDLHERVFAWMTLGDERNLVATLVAGRIRRLQAPGRRFRRIGDKR